MKPLMTIMEANLETWELESNTPIPSCEVCGEALQKDIVLLGKLKRVPVSCRCRQEQRDKERQRIENDEKQRRLDRVFKNSLMDVKFHEVNFENWNHQSGNEKLYNICFKYAENFSTAKKNNIGLIIYGEPGNGKSHATACIANTLLKKGTPVVCVGINALLERIKETYSSFGKEGEETVIRTISQSDLLVLDDLGTEQVSEWSRTKIYNIIDARYRNELPTIITANIQIKDLETHYGKRTYDRILEMCTPVLNDWKSIRIEKGKEKTKILKEILG